MIKVCANCEFLSLTEEEQNRKYAVSKEIRETHRCNFYNKQVKHNGRHPLLPMPSWCERES